ncbi:DUF488 domain-containing protein [Verrucomicrobiota bacterium sgz303538]
MKLLLKRAYDPPAQSDGERILIDRIWPRGVSKENASIDLWLKEIAPSTELRRWYGHKPERWQEFRHRYYSELEQRPEVVAQLRQELRKGPVTLVFGAKDVEHSNAEALREYLQT